MFTISPELMQQCIDMVAKEQDYIPFPDGIEADYSVYNIPGEGVWIVEPWAKEGGDYNKVQEIVLPEQKEAGKFYVVFIVLPDCRLQRCMKGSSGSDGDRLADADLIYSVYEKHHSVVMYECNHGGAMRAIKRNY